jgi:hypothetical protein
MNTPSRAILICSLAVFATVLYPLTGAAQPAYSVRDLGNAPEPIVPEPYNVSNAAVEFVAANPSGQTILNRFIPGNSGANLKAFYWEPRRKGAPVLIGNTLHSIFAAAISSNGYVAGTDDGHPYYWSNTTNLVYLQAPPPVSLYFPLAVNASTIVVGVDTNVEPHRAILWNKDGQLIYLDDLEIEGRGPWVGFEHARTISDDGVITGIGRFTTSGGVVEPHYFALIPTTGNDGALNRSDWTANATEVAPGDFPAHAIDGDINTRWSTGQAQHDSQGFQVGWANDRMVGRIRFEVGPSAGDYPTTCGIWVTSRSGQVTFVNCAVDGAGNVDVSFTPIPVWKIEVWQWGSAPAWWSIAEFNAYSQ